MTEAAAPLSRRAAREQAFRWLVATVGALFLAFAALGAVFLWYDNATTWVSHTRAVRTQIDNLMQSLTDAESAQRGLLLADDPRFEQQLTTARGEIENALAALQVMTVDNAGQQRRIVELGALQMQRMAAIEQSVGKARAGDRAGALATVRAGDGLRAMAAVRSLVDDLQREEATLEARRAGRARDVRIGLLVALLAFAGALSALFMRALRDINLDREAEAAAAEELRGLLAQRNLLLAEVNHRVKNSLQQVASVIRLQSRTVSHKGAREALEQALGRIMAVGRVHEQLYRSGADVGVFDAADYTRTLATELVDSLARDDIRLELDLSPATLSLDKAIPLALILNELVTNALKYGCLPGTSGCLRVRFSVVDEAYRLSVADDGPGVPAGFTTQSSKSLGMRVIGALARQLNGRLVVESPPVGAEFAVIFPKGAL